MILHTYSNLKIELKETEIEIRLLVNFIGFNILWDWVLHSILFTIFAQNWRKNCRFIDKVVHKVLISTWVFVKSHWSKSQLKLTLAYLCTPLLRELCYWWMKTNLWLALVFIYSLLFRSKKSPKGLQVRKKKNPCEFLRIIVFVCYLPLEIVIILLNCWTH